MDFIKGTIETISRPFNGGWRFASVPPHGTVVGHLPGELRPGDFCVFQGKWATHQKYGRQFQAEAVQVEIPKDVQGIRSYLDRHLKWVGPAIARQMIEAFGEDLFRVIEHEPERLAAIQGVTMKRAGEIRREFLEIKNDRELDIFFAIHGITLGMRNRLVDRYGSKAKAIRKIKENPYALADEVWGIAFRKADAIALSMGIAKESGTRLQAGVRWVLQEAADGEGHCYLPAGELLSRCREILEVGDTAVQKAVNAGIQANRLRVIGSAVYHADLHTAEQLVAGRLRELVTAPHRQVLNELTPGQMTEMDPDQQRALDLALSSKIAVITGGPGTGKTWTVNRIIQALGDRDIQLAAPTGKAAKRMTELSGRPAQTIHRLIEFNPHTGGFARCRENPIKCETLIIDETSMIDIRLMASLMDAVTTDTQVIFVGDVDQLPPVGPGAVLRDVIESESIPVARLKTLHRQAARSLININAQRINQGKRLELDTGAKDFLFAPEEDVNAVADLILKACARLPEQYGFAANDVQVLCPQKKGPIGSEELNRRLRPVLNPAGEKLQGAAFHSGDRVIQTRNNYGLMVFNGDIGQVTEADKEYLYVRFDAGGREVPYPLSEAGDLQLAYALTVHRSQGSEFPAVIMPVHTSNYMMLQRNLVYTGITRGKRLVVIIGSMKAVTLAIRNTGSRRRHTNLARFIREGKNKFNCISWSQY